MTSTQLSSAAASIGYDRHGSPDAPKLLAVHGFGSMRLCWSAVADGLAEQFDLVVVDLPGFGTSPLLAGGMSMDAPGYAKVLGALMDTLGWTKAHTVGNSLGGWIALELALLGRAESVTALAPAGLWPRSAPLNAKVPMVLNRFAAMGAGPALRLLKYDPVRRLALASLFGDPLSVPGDHAILHARGFAKNTGYHHARRPLSRGRFMGGEALSVPITVVFGGKDRLIRRSQSDLTTLPTHTRFESPRSWGHVPMYDDPSGVIRLIRETSGV